MVNCYIFITFLLRGFSYLLVFEILAGIAKLALKMR